ncbi:hypothetical protein B7P34_20705 [Streptosporangium nondiastaticum]|uniref:Phage tail protein n=1 Tax=Streptosporangium nondiastaticum TaxID=35764 RepID=A0A9X7JN82_9ACTN|nr:phage tail protein [Streptosporangium nondiastaticum]PSJ26869.1 hypothetical protein B7P34_20705 [Streptosporangium nondiastaticum]
MGEDDVGEGRPRQCRQNITIAVMDPHKNVLRRINLTNAWASQWNGPELSATSTEAAIERVTIAYDEITLE